MLNKKPSAKVVELCASHAEGAHGVLIPAIKEHRWNHANTENDLGLKHAKDDVEKISQMMRDGTWAAYWTKSKLPVTECSFTVIRVQNGWIIQQNGKHHVATNDADLLTLLNS